MVFYRLASPSGAAKSLALDFENKKKNTYKNVMVYAFISKDYYAKWAEEEILHGKTPSPLTFLKEFGTPSISLVYPEKEEQYSKVPPDLGIEVRYSYYADLKKKYPHVFL